MNDMIGIAVVALFCLGGIFWALFSKSRRRPPSVNDQLERLYMLERGLLKKWDINDGEKKEVK